MGSYSGRRPEFGPIFIFTEPSETQKVSALSMQRLGMRSLMKRILIGAAALLAISVMPAQAEELKDWQYDAQTRSLTFTLPDSVVPLISVVAPDQLVLELPDTQVGNVMGQSIRDGLVDSIVLEQATPETVWVVMDFAAGTVLSATQDVTLISEPVDGIRQWQMRPALVAASRRAAQSVASADVPADSAASVLRTPSSEIAQSPDFSELPILEPAMPIDEPVRVPPLTPPSVSVPPLPAGNLGAPSDLPSVVVPPLQVPTADAPAEDESSPVFDVEVIPAEPPVAIELEPVDPSETASGRDSSSPTALSTVESQAIPAEPPFLGDIEGSGIEDGSQSVPVEPVPVEPIPVEPLPNEPPVAVQSAPNERFADSSDTGETIASESAAIVPNAEPVAEVAEIEPVQPANVSRWPEPIPFGQPLPK